MKKNNITITNVLSVLVLQWCLWTGTIHAQEKITVNQQKVPLNSILVQYEQLSGRRLILGPGLDGEFTVASVQDFGDRKDPKNIKKALEFIEATLLMQGVAFVPSGDGLAKVINFQGGNPVNPEMQDQSLYSDINELPPGDEVVTFLMKFENVTPQDAANMFNTITTLHSYGRIYPLANTSGMLITENSNTIKYFDSIRKEIDQPGGGTTPKWFKLQRADAEQVATEINEILQAQSQQRAGSSSSGSRVTTPQSGTPPRPPIPGRPNIPGVGAPSASSSAPDAASVVLRADARTNRILVIARPMDQKYIEELIREYDSPNEIQKFLKRPLTYISSIDMLPLVANALSSGQETQSVGGQGGGNRSNTSNRNNNANRNSGNSGGFGNTGGGAGGGSSLGNRSSRLDAPQVEGAPESVLIGKTLIIADPQSNSILVSGPPDQLELVTELLTELDVRPMQVYLSTVIGQLTLGDDINYGMDVLRTLEDFEVDGRRVRGAGLFQSGTGGGITDVDLLDTVGGFVDNGLIGSASQGLNFYGQVGDLINVYVQMLENTNKFKVLSRPSIYVKNNRRGVIASGQRIAVPTTTQGSIQNTGVNSGILTNIDYRDVVLQLEVTPLINSKDEVTLQIAQVNDTIVGSQNIGGNDVPTIGTQELETEVTVPNKSTVILGGLITETVQDTNSGAPFLVRVPLIKHLFGRTSKTTSRQELLIFIQPTIVGDKGALVDANMRETRHALISEPTLEFAKPVPEIHEHDSFKVYPAKNQPQPVVRGVDDVKKPKGILSRWFGSRKHRTKD